MRHSLAAALLLALAVPQAGSTGHGTLVVTNMNDHTATLVDAATMTVRATLPTGTGPHEAAVSHDGRWAVVSNYGVRGAPGSTLTVIDLDRAIVTRTIDLAPYRRPHGMAFLADDRLLAVTSEASRLVLLVDFAAGRVTDTIPTRGAVSHLMALAPNDRVLVTTNIADGSITALDPRARTSGPVIPVARQVEGITITPDGKQVWVGSNGDSIVVVVDVERGQPIDTLRGFGMPYRLGATPDGRRVVVSDPVRGEIRIFDAVRRRVEHVITVPRDGLVETAEVPGSPSPEGVAVSRDGKFAYVTLQGRNQVAAVDLASGRITGVAPVGTWPDGIAYSPRGR